MVVHVNKYYAEQGMIVNSKTGVKINSDGANLEHSSEKGILTLLTSLNLKDVSDLYSSLKILNKIKEAVNKTVCRRNSYYHTVLYNVKTGEVKLEKLEGYVKAYGEVGELIEHFNKTRRDNTKISTLLSNGYKVAFFANQKLDWYFSDTDFVRVFTFHDKHITNN